MREIEAKILDLVCENPGIGRWEVARKLGISYATARRYLDMLYLAGILRREYLPKIPPAIYYWAYFIRRGRRKVVLSFKYTREEIEKLRKKKPEYEPKGRAERLIEIIVEVDKPLFIPVEPEYVLVTLLDHSAWAFSIGTRLAVRAGRREFPGRFFWKPTPIKERIPLRVKPLSPEIRDVNVGTTDWMDSLFKKCEFKVRIVYTDYNYPRNSFIRENIWTDFVEKWKKDHLKYQKGLAVRIGDEIRRQLAEWIIGVCNEEFAWWTPKWAKERYGVEWT